MGGGVRLGVFENAILIHDKMGGRGEVIGNLASEQDVRGAFRDQVAREQDGSNPAQGIAAVWEGRCSWPVPVLHRCVVQGVSGGPTQDTLVIEDAAPCGACRSAVVLPDGREVESELMHRRL